MPALFLPAYNPDLFWHLSAGRWIAEHWAVPRQELWSFTRAGATWQDFEWLAQLFFYGAHQLGGLTAIWLLKVLLFAGAGALLVEVARLHKAPLLARAGAFAAWAVASLPVCDARPEAFSLILLCALIWGLEAHRLGRRPLPLWAVAAGFALWANLHAGFLFGLLLLGLYAAEEAARPWRWGPLATALAAAAAATLVNPYGIGPYTVAFEHWSGRAGMSSYIQEWGPQSLKNPFHLPFWPLLAGFIASASLSWRRLPAGLLLFAWAMAVLAIPHARMAAYFAAAAVPLIAVSASGLTPSRLKEACLAAALAAGIYLAWALPSVSWRGVFDFRHEPVAAASFVERERPVFERLRVYNEWEWGGYLGWRLPWHKVFWDGRYLFHDLLNAGGEAARSPEAWTRWLSEHALEGALAHNRVAPFLTRKRYRDGTTKDFWRPWYLQYFPRQRWALVYWDEQALVFVRRDRADAAWLSAREYRWLLPRDEEARAEALRLGEIPPAALAAEEARHRAEVR